MMAEIEIYEQNIELNELIDDMNDSKDCYSFIHVLDKNDRNKFVACLNKKMYNDIYKNKSIKLGIFVNIMKTIDLDNNYIIYRRAYEGETIGKRNITNILSKKYVVPLFVIDKKSKIKSTLFDTMFDLFGEKKYIRILLEEDHMINFEFKIPNYILSSWENIEYILDNKLYK